MAIVALVLALHVALASVWLMQPDQARVAVSEMSVSVAIQQAAEAQPVPDTSMPQPSGERIAQPVAPVPQPSMQETVAPPSANVSPEPAIVAPPAVAAAPVVDTVPDYRAAYLNNPRPAYPMVARRMGWEGRVVLNVEVLAEGSCGAVNVFQSSGHEALDNAAMRTVQSWRFVPASRAGHAVTQWFKVPIQFSLKDNEA